MTPIKVIREVAPNPIPFPAVHGVVWNQETDTNGMFFHCYIPAPITCAELAALSGLNPYDPNNYIDHEGGYDGWELHGTFMGEAFNIYARYGVLRIGGREQLDALALCDMLTVALRK